MDLIRRPYTTKFRPFRDSELTVDIVWYPCVKDAKCLDVPSVVCSLDWWVQERDIGVFNAYPVGEVPGATRKYNGQKPKPGFDGTTRCGTDDDFANGAILDDAVNRPRNNAGLPICCGGVPKGIVIGGRAGPPPDRPGVVVGGHAVPVGPPRYGFGKVVMGGHTEASRCCFDTLVEHPDILVTIPDGPRSAGSPFTAAWVALDFSWRFTDGSGEECRLFCQTGHWFVTKADFTFIGDSVTFTCNPLAALMSATFGSSGPVTLSLAP